MNQYISIICQLCLIASSICLISCLVYINCAYDLLEGEIIISSLSMICSFFLIREKILFFNSKTISELSVFLFFALTCLILTLLFCTVNAQQIYVFVSCIYELIVFCMMIFFSLNKTNRQNKVTLHIGLYKVLENEQTQECSICMEPLKDYIENESPQQLVVKTTCDHYFHSPCLVQWVMQNKTTCPNCRSEIAFEERN